MLNHKVRRCVIKCWLEFNRILLLDLGLSGYWAWNCKERMSPTENSLVIVTEVSPLDFHRIPTRRLPGLLLLYISRQIDNGKHRIQCSKTEWWEPRSVLTQTPLSSTEELRTKRRHTRPRDTHGHPTEKLLKDKTRPHRGTATPARAQTADNWTRQPWRPHKRDTTGDLSLVSHPLNPLAKPNSLNWTRSGLKP